MTSDIPLQTGGSNSVSIGKANLPNVKLKVDSFSLTTQSHYHATGIGTDTKPGIYGDYGGGSKGWSGDMGNKSKNYKTSTDGGQNTGTASPSTETLGSGTPLNIQPEYITLKFWKRLT